MTRVIKPPEVLPVLCDLFLAGSIEMGAAPDWQAEMIATLKNAGIIIANPRRDDWDSSWKQSMNSPRFREQVEWELEAMDRSEIIALNLVPGTMSPISLLEFGLHATSDKLIVCCPPEFHRSGNILITAHKYQIPVYDNFQRFQEVVRTVCELRAMVR